MGAAHLITVRTGHILGYDLFLEDIVFTNGSFVGSCFLLRFDGFLV